MSRVGSLPVPPQIGGPPRLVVCAAKTKRSLRSMECRKRVGAAMPTTGWNERPRGKYAPDLRRVHGGGARLEQQLNGFEARRESAGALAAGLAFWALLPGPRVVSPA